MQQPGDAAVLRKQSQAKHTHTHTHTHRHTHTHPHTHTPTHPHTHTPTHTHTPIRPRTHPHTHTHSHTHTHTHTLTHSHTHTLTHTLAHTHTRTEKQKAAPSTKLESLDRHDADKPRLRTKQIRQPISRKPKPQVRSSRPLSSETWLYAHAAHTNPRTWEYSMGHN